MLSPKASPARTLGALTCLLALAALYLNTLDTHAVPRGRSSGRSSRSSRISTNIFKEHSSPSSTPRQSTHRASNPQQNQGAQVNSQQSPSHPPPPHQAPAPAPSLQLPQAQVYPTQQPYPPPHLYPSRRASSPGQAPQGYAHIQGHAPTEAHEAPSMHSHPQPYEPLTAHIQPATGAVASGAGGPSLSRTAVTSAVGAAVGSILGNAVANSLGHTSRGPEEAHTVTSTSTLPPATTNVQSHTTRPNKEGEVTTTAASSTYPSTTPHTTRFAPTTEAPLTTQVARPPLNSRSTVRVVFPGVGQTELQNSRGSDGFGAFVQDAVVRALGVPTARVVLEDVSLTSESVSQTPSVEVTLGLLPDELLLPNEPSSQELADEITRQLGQDTSYLKRQLRNFFQQSPNVTQPAIPVKALVLSATDHGKPRAASTQVAPVGVWVWCVLVTGMSLLA